MGGSGEAEGRHVGTHRGDEDLNDRKHHDDEVKDVPPAGAIMGARVRVRVR